MAGKEKYATRMAAHTGEPVDAACMITQPGGTARQSAGAVGGVVGSLIASKGGKTTGDINVGQYAWVGLTPSRLIISKASMMGKPTGEPIATVDYADVAEAAVTQGKITLRIDLALTDGRLLAFETKRQGANKPNVDVIELLRQRCTA